jgi:hypothetical protein
MKRGKALLILILMMSGASADSLGVPHRFADLKDDVAQEVRDTTAFGAASTASQAQILAAAADRALRLMAPEG